MQGIQGRWAPTCVGGGVHGGEEAEAPRARHRLQVPPLQQRHRPALALQQAAQPLQRLARQQPRLLLDCQGAFSYIQAVICVICTAVQPWACQRLAFLMCQ